MNRNTFLFFLSLSLFCLEGFGQPVYSNLDIKKPAKYENSKLGAEKTDETKFKIPRHFIQNTVTHYNYFFNATNKLNEVIARARAQNRDDYTKLLSFYDYSLASTSRDKRELDSIIYKATAGILNHDLRNDWIDNLYILMGKAFYFRNQLDSAYITFQFVNYAFSPKEKDGYDKPIGSNANSDEGGNSLIVATNEKRNILKKTFSLPPSRNESFIWQVKTYISNNQLTEAGGLIEVLKQDQQFPARLHADLEEVQAWLFYTQNVYDSAAAHLIKMLPGVDDRQEKSRFEYLIAQLYALEKKSDKAQEYFQKVFEHTYDPVMEVYARLNFIRQNKGTDDKLIQQNIDALLSMARKPRFENYRDIIYYTAAQIELERNNKPGAIALLLRSVKYALPENNQRDKAFVQLGDLYFGDKNYRPAKNYYDSVNASNKSAVEDPIAFLEKRKTLDKIISEMDVIVRQDSLQRIAAMTQNDRDAYIKKMVKRLRKQQGLAEEEEYASGNFSINSNNNSSNPFNNGNNNTEWYFYNLSLKSKGYSDFKSKWGNRKNTDFWQVSSKASEGRLNADNVLPDSSVVGKNGGALSTDKITAESLLKKIPLTPEMMKASNDSIEHSLFTIGKSFQEGLSDFRSAIKYYDSLLNKFTDTRLREETLFNLYYCYKKLGDEENAKRILKMMMDKYPNSKFTNIAAYPDAYKKSAEAPKAEATRRYEDIYNSFIEGRFEEAMADKKAADSAYGEKYWTPQLLYIEAVYLVKAREDNAAKVQFNNIIQKYPKTPMAAKAKTFLDVLARRKQIEDYLTKLQIERAKEDSIVIIKDEPPRNTLVQKAISDSAREAQKDRADSIRLAMAKAKIGLAQQKKNDSVKIGMNNLIFDRSQLTKIQSDSAQISKIRQMQDSIQQAMIVAKNDAAKLALLKKQADSLNAAMKKMKSDSADIVKQLSAFRSSFAYAPDKPQSVAILMNKVDPVYVGETKNAFNRYNQENFYNKTFDISILPLNDSMKIVVINGFENSDAALEYLDKAKKSAPREIVPWLPVGKYSFIIISNDNLEVLKTNKDILAYRKFLNASYPGKF